MKRAAWVLVSLVLVLSGVACNKVMRVERGPSMLGLSGRDIPGELQGVISEVSSGRLSVNGKVAVRFVHAVPGASPGRMADPKSLSIDPAVGGVLNWSDDRTLVFEPFKPLPTGTTFHAVLRLDGFAPEGKVLPPLGFTFSTGGNELADFGSAFQPAAPGDPKAVLLNLKVTLAKAVPPSVLDENARLFAPGGERIPLVWKQEKNDPVYTAQSPSLPRVKDAAKYLFTLDRTLIDAERDFTRDILLEPVQRMAVTDWQVREEGQALGLAVVFNEPLREDADYAAYLGIDPPLAVAVTPRGNTLLVAGDFQRNRQYTLTLRQGAANIWGGRTESDYVKQMTFADLKPAVEFSEPGAFLPTSLGHRLAFRAVNLKRVHLQVYKVHASNLGQFLQVNDLKDKSDWEFSEMNRVGEEVVSKELPLAAPRNEWRRYDIDLQDLFKGNPKGLFVAGLVFSKKDIDYDCPTRKRGGDEDGEGEGNDDGEPYYYYGRDYYEHPCSDGYYWRHNRVWKPVIVSDIGLLAITETGTTTAYATHLQTARPMAGVKVTLFSFQNQPLASATTDGEGKCSFDGKGGSHLVAERDDQRSILKFSSDRLSMDLFPVEGVVLSESSKGVQGFCYAERGIHRPGDAVYLSAILREGVDQKSVAVPVRCRVFNALRQEAADLLNKEGKDGLYSFSIPTRPQDPTGLWEARLFIGEDQVAAYPFRVETIAPPRIKAAVKASRASFGAQDKTVPLTIDAQYLFGAPASGLGYALTAELTRREPEFDRFRAFTFAHPGRKFAPQKQPVGEGALDADGKARAEFTMPELENLPFGLTMAFRAEVTERGGRPVSTTLRVPYDPWPAYAGVNGSDLNWCKTNTPYKVPVVAVDPAGRPLPGRKLKVTVYWNRHAWWWDYGDRNDYLLRYKDDSSTKVQRSAEVVSGEAPVMVDFQPLEEGQYLIEVRDESGHETGTFTYASPWGGEAGVQRGGATLGLRSDKEKYRPGETARLSCKTPPEGSMLVTVVKGNTVLSSQWMTLASAATSFTVPVTAQMAPNVYVFAAAVQPHAQKGNDRPLRAYGVLPLSVEEPASRLDLKITAPEEMKPNRDLTVKVSAEGGAGAAVTVAVVDEGLLFLTDFKTPEPWSFFYRKIGLSAGFFDIYDSVMGLTPGPAAQVFRVGGDAAERLKKLGPGEMNRFPAVALFQGPVILDGRGQAELTFAIPNYMGKVRVMAVACKGRAYGSAEKFVTVKEDVVVLSTLPRVAAPGETFVMPVTLFATKDRLGKVKLEIETNDLLEVVGKDSAAIQFTSKGEQETAFTLKVRDKVGEARVVLRAGYDGGEFVETTRFMVRPPNPHVTQSLEKVLEGGGEAALDLPAFGYEGTRQVTLNLWRTKPVSIGKRLRWLMHYPYGCIEQTVSSVFPQLYLKEIIATSPSVKDKEWRTAKVDDAVNAGIGRLVLFSLPDGSFSYWPGSRDHADEWSNLYAGHFLIEAKRQGYFVPSILENWLAYERGRSTLADTDWRTRAYRLYLLALAGTPDLSAQNLLRENYMSQLDTIGRWYLAGAFKLAGADEQARSVRSGLKYQASKNYDHWHYCFGSTLGDWGVLLNMAVLFGDLDGAGEIVNEVNAGLRSDSWYSTHALSWALMGAGKFIQATWREGEPVTGEVLLPGGSRIPYTVEGVKTALDLTAHAGKPITVKSTSGGTTYLELVYEGIPAKGPFGREAKGMELVEEFLDESGNPVDIKSLPKGARVWVHLALTPGSDLDHVAVAELFPSGWEIENLRVTGEGLPEWTSKYPVNNCISFEDIRDDRIFWFMDKTRGATQYHFFAKVVAVTRGTFAFPASSAEAMYDHDFHAFLPHGMVEVK
jgi:hypothetical protein